MLDIGLSELLIILAVALIVLGPKKLPEVARSLGRGLAQFRRASEDLRSLSKPLPDASSTLYAYRTAPGATPWKVSASAATIPATCVP